MNTNVPTWIKRHAIVLFFILAYAISWAFMIPVALTARGLPGWHAPGWFYYFASFGPAVSALIVLAIIEGWAGIRKLLARLLIWRVPFRYYAFAIFAPIALFMLAAVVNRILNGSWPNFDLLGQADYLPYLGIPGVLLVWILTYGIGEEIGWRGFALPRLQRTLPAANAALLLGLLWAFWHLPAFFFRDTYTEMGVIGFPLFAVNVVFASVVFAWLYNSTGGSLLLVILFHVFFNWLSVSEAGGQYVAIIMSAPMVAWAIYVVRHYQPENVAPVIKQIA